MADSAPRRVRFTEEYELDSLDFDVLYDAGGGMAYFFERERSPERLLRAVNTRFIVDIVPVDGGKG